MYISDRPVYLFLFPLSLIEWTS